MSYKVFVRKVPKNATDIFVRSAFEEAFGEVVDVSIPIDSYTFKPRGFVYVTFKNQSSMTEALRRGTCSVMGTMVEISTVEVKKKGKQCQRLFIKGLPTDSSEEELLKFFESLGHVALKIFPKDKNTGLLRNFCYITFESEELTNKLLDAGYMTFNNNHLTVVPAQRRDQLYPDSYDRPVVNNKVEELTNAGHEEYDPTQYSAAPQYPPPNPQDPYGYGQYYGGYSYPPDGQYYDPNYGYPPDSNYYGYPPASANSGYPPAGANSGYPPAGANAGYPPAGANSGYPPTEGEGKPAEPPAGYTYNTESTGADVSQTATTDAYGYPPADPAPTESTQLTTDAYGYPQEKSSPSTAQPADNHSQTQPLSSPHQPANNYYGQPPHSPYQPHNAYNQHNEQYGQYPSSPYCPPPDSPYGQPPSNSYQPHDPYGQPPTSYGQPPHSSYPRDPYGQHLDPYGQHPDPYGQHPRNPYPQDPYGQPPYEGRRDYPPHEPYHRPPREEYSNRGWDRRDPPHHERRSRWDQKDPNQESHDYHSHRDRSVSHDRHDRHYRDRSRSRNRESNQEYSEDANRLFVQGIPSSATEDLIYKHFSPYGKVVKISIPTDWDTGRIRDLAFITMERPEDVDRCIREAPREFMGVSLKQICRARTKNRR